MNSKTKAAPAKEAAKVKSQGQSYPSLEDLSSKRQAKIAKRREAMPERYRKLYDRVTQGTASPRAAIRCFCLECTGWIRDDVSLCTGLECPLWPYRPYAPSPQSPRESEFTPLEATNGEEKALEVDCD